MIKCGFSRSGGDRGALQEVKEGEKAEQGKVRAGEKVNWLETARAKCWILIRMCYYFYHIFELDGLSCMYECNMRVKNIQEII